MLGLTPVTFGYEETFEATTDNLGDYLYCFRMNLEVNVYNIDKLWMYCPQATTVHWVVGIYDDTGSLVPNNLLSQSDEQTGASEGWNEVDITRIIHMKPGTYWYAFISDGQFKLRVNRPGGVGSPGYYLTSQEYSSTLPDPHPGGGTGNFAYWCRGRGDPKKFLYEKVWEYLVDQEG